MMVYYKGYWHTLYRYVVINRLYDLIDMDGNKEELQKILENYKLTYTYLHGGALISGIEERKKLGEYIT